MNRKPELPVEIEKALRRYLEIQAEEQQLKEEKNDLRERIGEHMAGLEMKYWYPKIDGQALKVRCRETRPSSTMNRFYTTGSVIVTPQFWLRTCEKYDFTWTSWNPSLPLF